MSMKAVVYSVSTLGRTTSLKLASGNWRTRRSWFSGPMLSAALARVTSMITSG